MFYFKQQASWCSTLNSRPAGVLFIETISRDSSELYYSCSLSSSALKVVPEGHVTIYYYANSAWLVLFAY